MGFLQQQNQPQTQGYQLPSSYSAPQTNALSGLFAAPQPAQAPMGGDMSYAGPGMGPFNLESPSAQPSQPQGGNGFFRDLPNFFSPERIAQRRPLSDAIGRVGDTLLAIGGDRSRPHDQWMRENQSRDALSGIFQDQNNTNAWNDLAKVDPTTALNLRRQMLAPPKGAELINVKAGERLFDPTTGQEVYAAPEKQGIPREAPLYASAGGVWDRDEQGNPVFHASGYVAPEKPIQPDMAMYNTPGGTIAYDRRNPTNRQIIPGTKPLPRPAAAKKADQAAVTPQAMADFSDGVKDIKDNLNGLLASGAINSSNRGVGYNLGATASRLLGPTFGGATGDKAQTHRQNIESDKSQLLYSLKGALGLTSQQMNSDKDVQTLMKALGDPNASYETQMQAVTNLEKRVAARSQSAAQPAAIPQAGEVRNGYKFRGGNPNDKSRWEKVQ